MPTREEVAKQPPLEQRLGRMSRTADDLAAAIRGQSEAALVQRPDSKNWAANEVICHLRDIEEVYFVRFHTMLSNDDPKIYADPSAADRFAEDRQYLRNDAAQALAAFRRRREESLALLHTLTPGRSDDPAYPVRRRASNLRDVRTTERLRNVSGGPGTTLSGTGCAATRRRGVRDTPP